MTVGSQSAKKGKEQVSSERASPPCVARELLPPRGGPRRGTPSEKSAVANQTVLPEFACVTRAPELSSERHLSPARHSSQHMHGVKPRPLSVALSDLEVELDHALMRILERNAQLRPHHRSVGALERASMYSADTPGFLQWVDTLGVWLLNVSHQAEDAAQQCLRSTADTPQACGSELQSFALELQQQERARTMGDQVNSAVQNTQNFFKESRSWRCWALLLKTFE